MPTKRRTKMTEEQLLGEIETWIAGMQYYDATVGAGEQVNLEREPDNRHDPCSIRVENGRCQPVGHLPRQIVAWLAPLIDSDQVHIEGYVPQNTAPSSQHRGSLPLALAIFLSRSGNQFLAQRKVRNKLDALHEVVRRSYEDATGYADAELIDGLVEGLRPLARQELLPESRMLLAMLPEIAREKRMAQSIRGMARLRDLVGVLQIGAPLHHESLTVFPLIWPDPCEPAYTLLEPAIEAGTALVEEVSENGDVPHLGVTNNGPLPILIPEGEVLVGAKQNRVVNVTVLVAAHCRFRLPVSCVEQGRWRYQRRDFRGQYAAPPSIRSKKLRSVQRNRRECGEARSDQGEVWNDVAACLDRMGVDSQTASLADGYASAETRLRECREKLVLPKESAGLLVARHGKIVGMDLFGSPRIFHHIKPRLMDAYLLDSLHDQGRSRKAKPDAAREFLHQAVARACPRVPALGEGIELEIQAEEFVGSALLYGDQLCHLAAFSTVS
ncbi:MAG: ARPP-1 family domain-containing protein [Thermoguttaceae bacterium]|jgi:hypothetical protein